MGYINLELPALGEGVIEATITKWMIREGDSFSEDDPIVEIATDKVDSEVVAPVSGILHQIKKKENDTAAIGEVIAVLETAASETSTISEEKKEDIAEKKTSKKTSTAPPKKTPVGKAPQKEISQTKPFIPPFIRTLAKDFGIDHSTLYQIQGTGPGNTIKKDDLMMIIEEKLISRKEEKIRAATGFKDFPLQTTNNNYSPDKVEILNMDRNRQLIARHMIHSKQTSAHVTSFLEVDVTEIVHWRERIKSTFLAKEGFNLTYTAILADAVIKTLKNFPLLNASVEDDKIIIKKFINLGIATALSNNSLIVPVVKEADRLNLTGLAGAIHKLSQNARNNTLNPSDIKDGTFTITNVGQFESLIGTPIINQPQVAILAAGSIIKKPAVVETRMGDSIGIRKIMMLALSYDHRIIDGAMGSLFLKNVKEQLNQFHFNKINE